MPTRPATTIRQSSADRVVIAEIKRRTGITHTADALRFCAAIVAIALAHGTITDESQPINAKALIVQAEKLLKEVK